MSIGPGQPDREPLTPEEREWAQRLSRLGPSAGPPSAIDARILAAAHDAVAARPRAHDRGRRRWPVALGVAASVALAVGVAWQLRPMPETMQARSEAEVAADRAFGGPSPPPEPAGPPQIAPAIAPPPSQEAEPASAKERKREAPTVDESLPIVTDESRAADTVTAPVPAAPPPPPDPAMAPPADAKAAASTAAANADTAAGAAVSAQESERMQKAADAAATQRAKSLSAPPEAALRREALEQRQAVEEQVEIVGSDDGDEPPAYANSPQVREAWLNRIRELIAEGNLQQAHDSLDEFKRRYPGHALPEDLKQFEQSKLP